jgi:hypothetical protein
MSCMDVDAEGLGYGTRTVGYGVCMGDMGKVISRTGL